MQITPELIAIATVAFAIINKLVDLVTNYASEQLKKNRGDSDKEKAARNHILWPHIERLQAQGTELKSNIAEVKESTDRIDLSLRGDGTQDQPGILSEIRIHGLALRALDDEQKALEKRVTTLERRRAGRK